MNTKNTLKIGILFISLLLASCSQDLFYKSIKNQTDCNTKNGYWYKDKCWKDFDENEAISASEIDSTVAAQMKIIDNSKLVMAGKTKQLVSFIPVEEDKGLMIVAVYKTDERYKSFMFLTGKKQKEIQENKPIETPVILFDGDMIGGEYSQEHFWGGKATIEIKNMDDFDIEIHGSISKEMQLDAKTKKTTEKDIAPQNFSFQLNEAIMGAGNSHLDIRDGKAYLSGDLGTITYAQIKGLIKNHPQIKTIVMGHISGSVNDEVNMHTGRLLHENGFTTKVLSNSDIASGGVDLFCAGVKRIVEKGAKIGVHSWCCFNDIKANELPKDHPAHQYQLAYYTMALGPKNGPDFYFYTLQAAPFDDVHYMSDEEIKKWHVATEFVEENNRINTSYLKKVIDKTSKQTDNTGILFLEKNGQKEFVYATGFADKKNLKKINENDLFEIGSASKLFTSIAIFQLIEAGKISLNTPIYKFYSKNSNVAKLANINNKNYFDKVSIGMLLEHTSGFIDYLNVYGDDEKALKIFSKPNITYSFDDIINLAVQHGDANFVPGTKFQYSNTGYIILGDIISKITGSDWHDYIQEHIFDKIGLKNTYFASKISSSLRKNMPHGYFGNKETNMPASLASSAGEIISSLNDLKKFLIAWQNGKLISKKTLQIQQNSKSHKMYDEVDFVTYSYGVSNVNGFYGHGGQTFGFQSYICINPKTNKLYVIGANNASFDVFPLFLRLEALIE